MRDILIVEDSETDARLLKRVLQSVGVSNPIAHVLGGKQALKWLERAVAAARKEHGLVMAILFLDLKLPDLSGFEILARIKEEAVLAETLRIVLSQWGDLDSIRRAYSLGAHSFLNKPVTQEDVKELIKGFPNHWVTTRTRRRPAARQVAKNRRTGTDSRSGASAT